MICDTETKPKTTVLEPLFDKILVERDTRAETSEHGIYLPETATELPMTGKVLAVGRGICNFETGQIVPLPIKVGDRVMFSKYGGMVVQVDGKDHLIMSIMDVVGTVKDAAVEG